MSQLLPRLRNGVWVCICPFHCSARPDDGNGNPLSAWGTWWLSQPSLPLANFPVCALWFQLRQKLFTYHGPLNN